MRSTFGQWLRAGFDRCRVPCALHTLASCPVSDAGREILAGWDWVSWQDPPDWLVTVSGSATLVYEVWLILALFFPSLGGEHWIAIHDWLHRHSWPGILGLITGWLLGLIVGWFVVLLVTTVVGCAVANLSLFVGRSICFPVLLSSRWRSRVLGCGQVLGRMLDVLDCWLTPDDTIRIFRRIMPCIRTADAIKWEHLSPAQTVSRLLELRGEEFLSYLPEEVWPELITPDLSPDAVGILFRRSLQDDDTVIRAVSAAVVSHSCFSCPDRGSLLVRELTTLPPEKLATTLEMISEIGRSQAGHTMRSILENVQALGDAAAVRRFQAAMTLAPVQLCEDVFVYR